MEHLTEETFKEKIFDYSNKDTINKNDKPVLIDFYTTWCFPCKSISPVLDELSREYEGKMDIYKVDADEQPELSSAFGIRSVPTFMFVPISGEPKMMVGAIPRKSLEKSIKDIFNI